MRPLTLRPLLTLIKKDCKLVLGRGSGLIQALLLGCLLIFLFSLSADAGVLVSGKAAATIFWMASAFCQVLIFNTLYAYEERNMQRLGLLLGNTPPQTIWLGKSITALLVLLLAQSLFLPALAVFLQHTFNDLWPYALLALLLVDMGCIGLGALLGALSQGQNAKESLLSIIVFPVQIPLILTGISVFSAVFTGENTQSIPTWLRLAAGFDATFLGAAYFLFPFMYSADHD